MEHVDTNSKEYNEKVFRHYASLIQPMRVIEAKLAECTAIEKEMNKPRNIKKTIITWIVAIFVAFYAAAGIAIALVEMVLMGIVGTENLREFLDNSGSFVIMVIGVIIILEIVAMIFAYKKMKSMKRAKLEEKYRIAKEDFNKEFDKYEKDLKLVPKGYWNSNALDFLVKEYRSGKADTVKEALQAYDLYCHRNRLEQQQQQILQNQAMLSDQIKRNADDIIISMFMK